jgi:fumarate reductase subunit C
LVILAFAVYHTVTWFILAPQGMKPLRMKNGKRVPASRVVQVLFAMWAGASVVTLLLVWVLVP